MPVLADLMQAMMNYTTNQTAERLNCSRSTVINLIHAGKLPAFRVGKNWRVARGNLEKFMTSGGAR